MATFDPRHFLHQLNLAVRLRLLLFLLVASFGPTVYAAQPAGRPEAVAPSVIANDPEILNQQGVALAGDGEWKRAVSDLQTAVDLKPGEPKYVLNLAAALRESGDLSDAVKLYAELAKADPDDPEEEFGLARTYTDLGQDQNAVTQYLLAEHGDPMSFAVHKELAAELIGLGRFSDAVEECRYSLCIQPSDISSESMLATCLAESGKVDSGVADLTSVLKLPGLTPADRSSIDVQLGSLLLQEGKVSDAVNALKNALTLTPGDPEVHDSLGAALWASGDKRDAAGEWKAAYCSNDPVAKHDAAVWLATP